MEPAALRLSPELRTPPSPATHVRGGDRPSSTDLELPLNSHPSISNPIVHSMRATSRRTAKRRCAAPRGSRLAFTSARVSRAWCRGWLWSEHSHALRPFRPSGHWPLRRRDRLTADRHVTGTCARKHHRTDSRFDLRAINRIRPHLHIYDCRSANLAGSTTVAASGGAIVSSRSSGHCWMSSEASAGGTGQTRARDA